MTEQNFTVWCNLAEEALKSCQYQRALKYYDLALKIRPNNYQISNQKGWILSKLKQYSGAIDAYNQANQILTTKLTDSLL